MKIKVNGAWKSTGSKTLCALLEELRKSREQLVSIVGGYHIHGDCALHDGGEIVLIEKGKLPPRDELERMMAARHTPGVHNKVKQARVAIAGLGGLGSNIALSLARTGVGHLHLVDFDIVEPSNLNRQQYKISHLGLPKTQALTTEIAAINPFIQVKAQCVRVTAENAARLFREDNIVCEAMDTPEAKAMLVNTLLEQCPQKVVVAASGMAGFGSGNAIKTRRIKDRLYICGDGETSTEIGRGLMAPRVSICAGHQANTVLRLILGKNEV